MTGECEFCGEKKELGDSTPFHGFYCMDCMRMNIEYDKTSIAQMKPERRKRVTEAHIRKLEREKDKALSNLMHYGN